MNLLGLSRDGGASTWIDAMKEIAQLSELTATDYQRLFKLVLRGLSYEIRGAISVAKPVKSRAAVARHEAAHMVVAMSSRLPPVYAFIGKFGGITALDPDAFSLGGESMAMSVAGMVADGNGHFGERDALIFAVSFLFSYADPTNAYRPGAMRMAFDGARVAAALALREHAKAHRRLAAALLASGELGARSMRRLAGRVLTRGLLASDRADFDTAASSAYYAERLSEARSTVGLVSPNPPRHQ